MEDNKYEICNTLEIKSSILVFDLQSTDKTFE